MARTPKPITNGDEKAVELQKRNAATSAATARLRKQYASEYDEYRREEFESRGLTYRRRLTADERAAEQVSQLIAANPAAAEAARNALGL